MGNKEDKGSTLGLLKKIVFTCGLHSLFQSPSWLTGWLLLLQGSTWGCARKSPVAFHPAEPSLVLKTLFSWLPWRHPLLGFLFLFHLTLLCQQFLLYLTSKHHSSLGHGSKPCPLFGLSFFPRDLIHFHDLKYHLHPGDSYIVICSSDLSLEP